MENRSAPQRLTNHAWALGFLAVFFFAVESLTGLGLTFHYRPVTGAAWADVTDLREVSGLGFVRTLHYWGSHALVIVVWLHLLRVFASGLYRTRRGNWTLGVALLAVTLSLAYTGALLPWDREAHRSIATREPAVSTRAAKPREIGQQTLGRFYALHCGLLPAVAVGLIVQHLRLARRQREPDRDTVDG